MNRYRSLSADVLEPQASSGWKLERLVSPSGLFGANGMQFGPDGRLYVAQAFGSQISALDIASGSCEVISPAGGPVVAPDDLAFDSRGILYATEVMNARVCARLPSGETRIVADGLPGANGITVFQDRVFMDECRFQGRLLELYPHSGRPPRLIAENLPCPNALMVGPDGYIYFPEIMAGEVWRIPLEGGELQRVASGLAVPVAVKFNRRGELVVPQAGNGEVACLDVQSGARRVIARLRPGIDNLAFSPDGRLFISHFVDGGVAEVATDGSSRERVLVPAGLLGPWGLSFGADGNLYVADGMGLVVLSPGGKLSRAGMLLDPGFPGFVRGLACGVEEIYVTTSAGRVASYHPSTHASRVLAEGFSEVYDLALAADGTLVVAEGGGGRVVRVHRGGGEVTVLARGLSRPTGLALAQSGGIFVSESGRGRVVCIEGDGSVVSVLEGLREPQGLALRGEELLVLDVGSKELYAVRPATRELRTLASFLPVGAPPGIRPQPLMGVPDLVPGPLSPFAGLAVGRDGTIYIAADGEGSVFALRPAS